MKSDAIVGALKAASAADIDVDEALDQLSELVDLAHAKPEKVVKQRHEVVLSEVPLGGDSTKTCVVAWDTCGDCHNLVSRCECKGGPVEPRYIKFFRSGSIMDSNSASGRYEPAPGPIKTAPTAVTSPSAESSLSRSSEDPVPSGDVSPVGYVRCSTCAEMTSESEGDVNDDGSFACYTCQEISA